MQCLYLFDVRHEDLSLLILSSGKGFNLSHA